MISHLGSDLVAALTSLDVDNFSHFSFFFLKNFFFTREDSTTDLPPLISTELMRLCSFNQILV